MRSQLWLTWAGIRWVLLMLLLAPSLGSPAATRPEAEPKPLRVWLGLASWYGPGFQGRLTAAGELYNMYAATAAHPTLPLGTIVRLVNPANGRARIVRINDRGPYIEGREIDVSYEVARWLGFDERGLARVRIELLEVPRRPWTATPAAD